MKRVWQMVLWCEQCKTKTVIASLPWPVDADQKPLIGASPFNCAICDLEKKTQYGIFRVELEMVLVSEVSA